MARSNIDRDQGTEKGKIRVLYIELEGNNQTLQDGLRTVSQMLPRPVQVQVPSKLIPSSAGASPSTKPDPGLFNQDPVVPEEVDEVEVEKSGADEPSNTRKKRGEGANRDRNAGLAIVKSLNLQPSDKESLKDFVARKRPKTQEEHIAVYIYYLKHLLEEPNIGFDHIYTCFRETGERVPGNLPQTCRNAASRGGWIDTADANDLKRTTRGDNLVEKDLPRSNSSSDSEGK